MSITAIIPYQYPGMIFIDSHHQGAYCGLCFQSFRAIYIKISNAI